MQPELKIDSACMQTQSGKNWLATCCQHGNAPVRSSVHHRNGDYDNNDDGTNTTVLLNLRDVCLLTTPPNRQRPDAARFLRCLRQINYVSADQRCLIVRDWHAYHTVHSGCNFLPSTSSHAPFIPYSNPRGSISGAATPNDLIDAK